MNITIKTALRGAIDQLGHLLALMIHAFAEATDNEKMFMAKWDVKDEFLENGLSGGGGTMELCIRHPATTRKFSNPSHTVLAPDEVGRISSLFLCGYQNKPQYCNAVQ